MENEQPRQCVIPLHKPSMRELVFFFLSGILVSVPMALFFSNTYQYFPILISTAFLAPFVEELAKVFPLFYRHGETERSIVTLGALTGLGFGISEFFLYVFYLHVPPIARVPGVIFHASSTSISAYGVAKKKPVPYYLISVALHATNNFFALTSISLGVFVELLVVVVAYLLAWQFYHKASPEKMVV